MRFPAQPAQPVPSEPSASATRRVLARAISLGLAASVLVGVGSLTGPANALPDNWRPKEPVGPPDGSLGSKWTPPGQASPAAAPSTPYQMPFRCGEEWTGSTRSSHSPSELSVDFNRVGDLGSAAVAAGPGTINVADRVDNGGYGKWVMINHGSDESTLYAHLDSVAVREGQKVARGQKIGTVGGSGNVTGPHLHFEERLGRSVVWPWFNGKSFKFGQTWKSKNCAAAPVDTPIAGDFDGDKRAQTGVFRRTTPAKFRIMRADGTTRIAPFGVGSDQPVIGDWNGDGTDNLGVRRPDTGKFSVRSEAGWRTIAFGRVGDLAIAGDWNGDGTDEVGIRRPGTRRFLMRLPSGKLKVARFGDKNDLPVTGDWDGDKVTDVGVFDQATATFRLRTADRFGTEWFATIKYGRSGDLPVTGDWNGDGTTDLGTWTPDTATFRLRSAATFDYGAPR